MFVVSLVLLALLGATVAQEGSVLDIFAGEYLDSPTPIRQMILNRTKKATEKKSTDVSK